MKSTPFIFKLITQNDYIPDTPCMIPLLHCKIFSCVCCSLKLFNFGLIINCFSLVHSWQNTIQSVQGGDHKITIFSVQSVSGQKITGYCGDGMPKTLPSRALIQTYMCMLRCQSYMLILRLSTRNITTLTRLTKTNELEQFEEKTSFSITKVPMYIENEKMEYIAVISNTVHRTQFEHTHSMQGVMNI